MITIAVEQSIPFVPLLDSEVIEVRILPHRELKAEQLKDCDALVIRSITPCGEQLLKGTNISLVATATSGIDHIDTTYCKQEGIAWANAAGGNARAVAEWVVSTLLSSLHTRGQALSSIADKTLGIVGYGHVGQELAPLTEALGYRTLFCDPPRVEEGYRDRDYQTLDTLIEQCDVLTVHTPLIKEGRHRTLDLLSAERIGRLKPNCLLINAARGGIVNSEALANRVAKGELAPPLIDCWSGEPNILLGGGKIELITQAGIATPHIAGFTADAKKSLTERAFLEVLHFFALPLSVMKSVRLPEASEADIYLANFAPEERIYRAVSYARPLTALSKELQTKPEDFARLRKQYELRREFSAYRVHDYTNEEAMLLSRLGFQLA